MAKSQRRAYAKETGKKYVPYRKKRLDELGSDPAFTRVGEKRLSVVRVRGGDAKRRLFSHNIANVLNQKTKKYEKATIKTVLDNPADRNLVRRNIMTKGAIIDTDKGKARITSRPGQDGIVNAILIS
ncbi:MAG TPA: 30S ribosomal protein S8e [Candidatus Nanoarchaeia archaeon]|nr:30S ribosomal protein S8e [Candidatus Nanoarchaeia archaeon]